jgi:hypothetical protein
VIYCKHQIRWPYCDICIPPYSHDDDYGPAKRYWGQEGDIVGGLDLEKRYSEPENTPSSSFSEFIRNATPEEKEAVYTKVIDSAIDTQNSVCGTQNGHVESDIPRCAPRNTSAFDSQVGGSHYKDMPIQPYKFFHANAIGKIEGDIIQYVLRFREKNGKQDLDKAIQCIQLLSELEYGDGTSRPSSD